MKKKVVKKKPTKQSGMDQLLTLHLAHNLVLGRIADALEKLCRANPLGEPVVADHPGVNVLPIMPQTITPTSFPPVDVTPTITYSSQCGIETAAFKHRHR